MKRTNRAAALVAALAVVLPGVAWGGTVPAAADTTIAGGTDVASAPPLPSGLVTDTFERGSRSGVARASGLTHYYQVHLFSGQRLHVAATVRTARDHAVPKEGEWGVAIELQTSDGKRCSDAGEAVTKYDGDLNPTLTALLTVPAISSLAKDECLRHPGEVIVAVTRYGDAQRTTPLPVDLVTLIEPAVDDPSLPAAHTREQKFRKLGKPSATKPIKAADTFASATALRARPYRLSLLPGRAQIVKIKVGYGQRLSYRVDMRGKRPYSTEVELMSAVRNPALENLALAIDTSDPDGMKEVVALDNWGVEAIGASLPVPVRWRNRESGEAAIAGISLPGWYYLVLYVTAPASSRQEKTPLPVTLNLALTGAKEAGPALNARQPSPSPSASTTSPASSPASSPAPTTAPVEPRTRERRWLWPVILTGALATGGVLLFGRGGGRGSS